MRLAHADGCYFPKGGWSQYKDIDQQMIPASDTGTHSRSDRDPCCAICLEDTDKLEPWFTHLQCMNNFHKICFDLWTEQQLRAGRRPTCPYCRGAFSTQLPMKQALEIARQADRDSDLQGTLAIENSSFLSLLRLAALAEQLELTEPMFHNQVREDFYARGDPWIQTGFGHILVTRRSTIFRMCEDRLEAGQNHNDITTWYTRELRKVHQSLADITKVGGDVTEQLELLIEYARRNKQEVLSAVPTAEDKVSRTQIEKRVRMAVKEVFNRQISKMRELLTEAANLDQAQTQRECLAYHTKTGKWLGRPETGPTAAANETPEAAR